MALRRIWGPSRIVFAAAAAQAQASVSAPLTTQIRLGGAASVLVTGGGNLSTSVRLAGGGAAVALGSATLSGGVLPQQWSPGNIGLAQGSATPFNVATTGPSGYTTGGVYGVDPSGTPLLAGMAFTEAGSLTAGSAGAGVANGVQFTYHEPGALPTLTLYPNQTGTLPYWVGIYPCKGTLPAGQVYVSPDDASLKTSVTSTWDDGSAKVCVVAGEVAVTNGVNKTIRLRPGSPSGTNLTTAQITATLSSVVLTNFPGGTKTLNAFGSPTRTWWANPRVIHAQYNVTLTAPLVAVVYVHAFAGGRTFVEVVVENSLISSAANGGVLPAAATYTGATVAVNGTTIATVSSSAGPNGTHEFTRAWYASTWVGGAPGAGPVGELEVTHDTLSMQAHPLYNKIWKASNVNMQATYGTCQYTPWATAANANAFMNVPNMGGFGDSPPIGPITQWDMRYVQSGDRYARRASVTAALCALTCNLAWRDTTSGMRSSFADIGNRDFQYFGSGQTATKGWPRAVTEPAWEHAHSPAVGLMAFMCRPSGVFVDIAQGAATWQHNWRLWDGAYSEIGTGYQVRGKGWTIRSFSHAIFITPDSHPWKAPAQTSLGNCTTIFNDYRNATGITPNNLGMMWNYGPAAMSDDEGVTSGQTRPGYQHGAWLTYYCGIEIAKISQCETIPAGPQRTLMDSLAQWVMAVPVRMINESTDGEWRAQSDWMTFSRGPAQTTQIDMPLTWTEMRDWQVSGTKPAAAGTWLQFDWITGTNWSQATAGFPDSYNGNNAYYPGYFYGALVVAVELGVPGADQAWQTLWGTNPASGGVPNGNLTNLNSWADGPTNGGGRTDPRWIWLPRNK